MTLAKESGTVLPAGYRWANSGGSVIGGANGYHIATESTSGTLCGRYAPNTPPAPTSSRICGACVRVLRARENV